MNKGRALALGAAGLLGLGLFGAGRWWAHDQENQRVAKARQVFASAVGQAAAVAPDLAASPASRRVDAARLTADVAALAFERATAADRARARRVVAHRLTELGYQPALQGFSDGINVVGERPGTDPTAGVVLVAAHYDSVEGSPGADDNATGVAAALELARVLGPLPTPAALRIALFDAEELGLRGSTTYAADPDRIAGLRAVVVLEMLGATCRAPGCQKLPTGLAEVMGPLLGETWTRPGLVVGDFLAVIGTFDDAALLAAFRTAGGTGLPGAGTGARPPAFANVRPSRPAPPTPKPPVLALPVPERGLPLPDTRRSDHAPFWDAGVRAVLVTDTADLRNPDYHRQTDVPATVDADFLAGATQVTVDAVWSLLHP